MDDDEVLERERMQTHIDALEAQANLDRKQISTLLAEVDSDRERIESLLYDTVLDRVEINRLAEVGMVDQGKIKKLLVDAVLDRQEVHRLNVTGELDRDQIEHLESALTSARAIGAAVGVAMERYDLDREKAFLYLIRLSQDSNRKLRDIAEEITGVTRPD